VNLEIPIGNSSVTLKATEGQDFQRLGDLFVERYSEELNGTQITSQAIVNGINKLIENGKASGAHLKQPTEETESNGTKYSAVLTVNMGEQKGKAQVLITEGDDIQAKSVAFCTKHGLGQKACADVRESMAVLLKEARVRGDAEVNEKAEMAQMNSHYMHSLAAILCLVLLLKLLAVAWEHVSIRLKKHRFDQSHKRHAQNKAEFLRNWDDMKAAGKSTKTGKGGNKISHRQKTLPAAATTKSKPKMK
jgi:hypothetical protein